MSDKKVLIRIPESYTDKVEELAEQMNVSKNDIYKVIILLGLKDIINEQI